MSDVTYLDHATTMIEKAWGRPIAELEVIAVQQPVHDPLLRAAMHVLSGLVISSNAVVVYQDRLHTLTRNGYVPAPYDRSPIAHTAMNMQIEQAESRTALAAIGHIIHAREAAQSDGGQPAVRLPQAAVARSAQAPRTPPGQVPDRPAPAAAAHPSAAGPGPRR